MWGSCWFIFRDFVWIIEFKNSFQLKKQWQLDSLSSECCEDPSSPEVEPFSSKLFPCAHQPVVWEAKMLHRGDQTGRVGKKAGFLC